MELEIVVKSYLREFFDSQMQPERDKSRVYNTIPALIIKDEELERFIDALWFHISKRYLGDKQAQEQNTNGNK